MQICLAVIPGSADGSSVRAVGDCRSVRVDLGDGNGSGDENDAVRRIVGASVRRALQVFVSRESQNGEDGGGSRFARWASAAEVLRVDVSITLEDSLASVGGEQRKEGGDGPSAPSTAATAADDRGVYRQKKWPPRGKSKPKLSKTIERAATSNFAEVEETAVYPGAGGCEDNEEGESDNSAASDVASRRGRKRPHPSELSEAAVSKKQRMHPGHVYFEERLELLRKIRDEHARNGGDDGGNGYTLMDALIANGLERVIREASKAREADEATLERMVAASKCTSFHSHQYDHVENIGVFDIAGKPAGTLKRGRCAVCITKAKFDTVKKAHLMDDGKHCPRPRHGCKECKVCLCKSCFDLYHHQGPQSVTYLQ